MCWLCRFLDTFLYSFDPFDSNRSKVLAYRNRLHRKHNYKSSSKHHSSSHHNVNNSAKSALQLQSERHIYHHNTRRRRAATQPDLHVYGGYHNGGRKLVAASKARRKTVAVGGRRQRTTAYGDERVLGSAQGVHAQRTRHIYHQAAPRRYLSEVGLHDHGSRSTSQKKCRLCASTGALSKTTHKGRSEIKASRKNAVNVQQSRSGDLVALGRSRFDDKEKMEAQAKRASYEARLRKETRHMSLEAKHTKTLKNEARREMEMSEEYIKMERREEWLRKREAYDLYMEELFLLSDEGIDGKYNLSYVQLLRWGILHNPHRPI